MQSSSRERRSLFTGNQTGALRGLMEISSIGNSTSVCGVTSSRQIVSSFLCSTMASSSRPRGAGCARSAPRGAWWRPPAHLADHVFQKHIVMLPSEGSEVALDPRCASAELSDCQHEFLPYNG